MSEILQYYKAVDTVRTEMVRGTVTSAKAHVQEHKKNYGKPKSDIWNAAKSQNLRQGKHACLWTVGAARVPDENYR